MALYNAMLLWSILIPGFTLYWLFLIKIWYAGLPPGPFPLPLIGNLLSLRRPAYECFANLSKKYGPVLFVRLGMLPVVVVNDAATAKEVLHAHDAEFANCPQMKFFEIFSFGFKDMVMTSYDRAAPLRKISNSHLFTAARLKSFTQSREAEIHSMVKSINSLAGCSINMETIIAEYTSNILCTMLFGHNLPNAKKVVQALMDMSNNATEMNFGVIFRVIDFLDLHGDYKIARKSMNSIKSFLEDLVLQKKIQSDKGDDFLNALLSLGTLDDTSVMSIITDMITGGLETSMSTIEWAMAEILSNLDILEQAQVETDKVVGRSRLVQESDLNNLPYILAIFKETLRLHPPLPLSIPHYNEQASSISGYRVPAKCQVLINLWAIGRDPNQWVKPAMFMPERFLRESKEVGLTGNFELLPFSAGRRMCAGYSLATKSIPLAIANMVHGFTWKPLGIISLEPRIGTITLKPASKVQAFAYSRLDQAVYL